MRGMRRWLAALLLPIQALATPASAAVWLDSSGQPSAATRDALHLLADAPADGLVPDDYHAAVLAARAAALEKGSEAASPSAFESDLDRALLRYLRDLRFGRVDPRSVGFRVARQRDALTDLPERLHAAAAQGRLQQLADELRPRLQQYGKLRDALARYRVLDASGSLGHLAATVPIRPGDPFGDAVSLHHLLIAFGDLPTDAPLSSARYDDILAMGVTRFQARHGLDPDGVIGGKTLAALNVPLAHRIKQLELALERLRWLPDLDEGRYIGINIPMFQLWAWNSARPDDPPISMGVVVGKALNTRTPVLLEEMRYLIFRPYWNVPRSILVKEVVPAMTRDPAYLQRNDMEVVIGQR